MSDTLKQLQQQLNVLDNQRARLDDKLVKAQQDMRAMLKSHGQIVIAIERVRARIKTVARGK